VIKPYLQRAGRGDLLPPGDPIRRQYLANAWAWGKLAAGAAAVLALRQAGLAVLWGMTLAGFALANSALITGLEFENGHWGYVHGPFGEILLLASAALVLDRKAGPAWWRAVWAVPLLLLVVAGAWRPVEALHAPEAARNSRELQGLRPLRQSLAALDR